MSAELGVPGRPVMTRPLKFEQLLIGKRHDFAGSGSYAPTNSSPSAEP